MKPIRLFSIILNNKMLISLSLKKFILSRAYVENVVKAPKKPTMKKSLPDGESTLLSIERDHANPIKKHPTIFTEAVPHEKPLPRVFWVKVDRKNLHSVPKAPPLPNIRILEIISISFLFFGKMN